MTTFSHKLPTWIKFTSSLFSLFILTLFSSCTEDENLITDAAETYIVYDALNKTEYPISVFNSKSQTVMMLKTDENGYTTDLDCYFVKDKSTLTITFNEDGLINGIGMDKTTIALSNYNGNKVDVAIIDDDETAILKEVESSKNWDKLAQKLSLYTSNPSTGANNSAEETAIQTVDAIKDMMLDFVDFGLEARLTDINGFPSSKVSVKLLLNTLRSLGVSLITQPKYTDYATFSAELISCGLSSPTTPWGLHISLISNYSTYEALITDLIYKFLIWKYDFIGNRNNGIGALNSGFGNLKATLSWNFYADVDLHAIEPSGTHIFYRNKTSDASGGFLDVDNREGGSGAIENIYWSNAENGEYNIYIDYFGQSTLNGLYETGTCTVSIYHNGIGNTYRIPLNVSENQPVTTISLPTGNMVRSQNSPKFKVILNNLKSRGIKK